MTDTMKKTEQQQQQNDERKHWETIWWGGAFIWIGLALGAEFLDILPQIGDTTGWWPWIFIGLGPWSLILNGYRQASDAPNPTMWDWVWTLLFVGVAIGAFTDFGFGGEALGVTVLVGMGAMILIKALIRDAE
ncbi:MAG: hypothetical protein U9N56_05100 [Actinomycetota bacterium]|nr:hypothetical protein [Actinomycetota bacterium]